MFLKDPKGGFQQKVEQRTFVFVQAALESRYHDPRQIRGIFQLLCAQDDG